MAIEGLGYLGSVDWGWKIVELIREANDDLYNKYFSYVVHALARMVTLAPLDAAHRERISHPFGKLEQMVAIGVERGFNGIVYRQLSDILSTAKPHHADHLLQRWLRAPLKELRELGSYAVGGMRVQRGIGPLLELAADEAEDDSVRDRAIFAIAAIGSPAAVESLAGLEVTGKHAWTRNFALAYCVVDAPTDDMFSELAQWLIAADTFEKCWVYRAIGRREDRRFFDTVRRGLGDPETTIRGDAALALARLAGGDERESLLRAHSEAGSSREHVLTTLALLAIGEAPPDDVGLIELRRILAAESWMYRSPTKHDIVEVLQSSRHPSGPEIAAAWEPIYAADSAY